MKNGSAICSLILLSSVSLSYFSRLSILFYSSYFLRSSAFLCSISTFSYAHLHAIFPYSWSSSISSCTSFSSTSFIFFHFHLFLAFMSSYHLTLFISLSFLLPPLLLLLLPPPPPPPPLQSPPPRYNHYCVI
jgi:hypothetical protein